MPTSPTTFLEFLISNPTAPVVLVSAIVAFLSWRTQKKLTRAKHSIDLQNNYLSSERILADIYRVAELSKELTSDEIERVACINFKFEMSKKDKQRLSSLRTVLNALERMAIGIRMDVYDGDLLFNSYATYVIETWIAFHPYIREKQRANSRYYQNVEWLAREWMSKRDRVNAKC